MGALKEPTTNLHEADFVAWAEQQAKALRERRLEQLDIDNLSEEIESMGRQQRSELVNRLAVLLAHLLKWVYQPDARAQHGRSWILTVKEQRGQTLDLIDDNPSLRPYIGEAMSRAYRRAVLIAAREAGIDEGAFAATCPYSFEQVTAGGWMPE